MLALGRGGALETVRDGETGLFFDAQEPAALVEAVRRAERMRFDPAVARMHAERFDRPIFKERLARWILKASEECREET